MNRSSLPLVTVAFFVLLGWLHGGLSSGGSAAGAGTKAGHSEATTDSPSKEAATPEKGEKGKKPAHAESKKTATSSDDGTEPWRQPLGLYEEFFGLSPDPQESRDAALGRLRDAVHPKGDETGVPAFVLQFMIALVPDPLDSQQPAAFDQTLDAIQHGFAYENERGESYLPDRIWIPWNDKEAVRSKSYRTSPGLLLFRRRREGQPPELVGVFLVGETPKTGIHKAAFQESLRLIAKLSGDCHHPVRILGPSYSGSALSLRIALLDWQAQHRPPLKEAPEASPFVIVTGSARAPCLEQLFAIGARGEVSFYRTQAPLDVLLSTALQELHDRMGWHLGRTALITELDTSFGDSVPNPELAPSLSCPPPPLLKKIAVVRFPSHISAIRTARVAAGLDRQETDSAAAAPPPPVTELQLDLADRRIGADLVPDFSPLSAPANEIAIESLVTALSRDGVRYVGILASDVKDTIFLADRIHRLAPNVTLFSLEGNLLFTHPQVLSALEGMTVISGTRLFTTQTSWERKRKNAEKESIPWQLTTSFAIGIYQATVELLRSDLLEDSLHQDQDDAGAVWISVVGKDALWPLLTKKITGDPESPRIVSFDKLTRLESRSPEGPLSVRSREAMLGTDLELVLFAALLCGAAWWLHQAALLPAPAHYAQAERGTRRLLVAGLAVLVISGAALVVLCALPHWPSLGREASPAPWGHRQQASFAALVLAYLGLTGAVIWAAAFRWSRKGGIPRLGGGIAAAVFALAAPCGVAWLLCRRGDLSNADFDQRVRAFASGLSPLVSLAWLVGAFFLWALVELKRRRLTAWQWIDWPIDETCEPALKGCSLLLDAVRGLLVRTLPRSLWHRLVLGAGLVIAPTLLWEQMQPATEPREVGRLMLVLWTLVAVLSSISIYRFFRLWQTLRRLLVRIESTPIAGRLKSLSEELHWKPMQAFGLPMPPFETLIDSLVRLKKLLDGGKLDLSARQVAKLQSELDERLGLAFAADVHGEAVTEIDVREKIQELIRPLADALVAQRDDPEVADFFAIRVAAYLRYIFAQLRSALITALGPALLLLIAVSSYTFQPKGVVTLGLLVLVAGEIALALSAFVQMSRDTVLSLIAGNPPGEVTLDFHFLSSVVTFGVVPLVGLVATQVPDIGQLLNSALKPLLHLAGTG